jgi:hypothetical protein
MRCLDTGTQNHADGHHALVIVIKEKLARLEVQVTHKRQSREKWRQAA